MLKSNEKGIHLKQTRARKAWVTEFDPVTIRPIIELTETNSIDSQQIGPVLSLSSEEEITMTSRFPYNKIIYNIKNLSPRPERSDKTLQPLHIGDTYKLNSSIIKAVDSSTHKDKNNSQPSLSPLRFFSLRDKPSTLEASVNIDIPKYSNSPMTDNIRSRNTTPDIHSSRERYRRVVYSCFDKTSESYKALQLKQKSDALPVLRYRKLYFHRKSGSNKTPSTKSINTETKHKKTTSKLPTHSPGEGRNATRKRSPEVPSKSHNRIMSVYGLKPISNRGRRLEGLNELLI